MKSVLAFVSVWGFTLSLLAGEASFVKPEPSSMGFVVQFMGTKFAAPAKDAGTINPHAVVVDMAAQNANEGKTLFVMAIDSSKPDSSRPDVIRLDFGGKGNFSDAPTVKLKSETSPQEQEMFQATFGPEVVQVNRGSDVLPVLVQGRYFKSNTFRYMMVQVQAALQDNVSFGQKTHAVCIVDCNGNFDFSDASTAEGNRGQFFNVKMGDYLSIDVADDGFKKPLTIPIGQPVRMDGQWYLISYLADKKQISAQAVQIPTATIQHDQSSWTCKLANKDRVLCLSGGKEPVEVPAGDYCLVDYQAGPALNSNMDITAPKDALLYVTGQSAGYEGLNSDGSIKVQHVVLPEGKTCTLEVGAPLQAKCVATVKGRDITFSMQLADRNGNKVVYIYGPGGKRENPKISVIDSSGASIYDNTLEFG